MLRLRQRNTIQPRLQSRRPAIEPLESITLLAGNVITTPTGTGAFMAGGNDKVELRNLTLSGVPDPMLGFSTVQVVVDGGAGDDRITMFNTTIDASAPPPDPDVLFFPTATVGILLFGETSAVGDTSGTGNDVIEVSNTTITAEGGEVSTGTLQIFGDDNNGGTITGGNDHINVSNTEIRAANTSFALSAQAFVVIYGDNNTADDLGPSPTTSIIGEGNDWINVNNTDIIADSAQGSGAGLLQVYGDNNTAFGAGTATIGDFAAKTGGNDTISLTNTTVSAQGGLLSNNSVMVDVRGDQNFSQAAAADVGGGNDNISIKNFAASASGLNATNETDLRVFGDGDVRAALIVTSRIGGGNDVISLTNDDIFSTGNPNNIATVEINSDDANQQGEVASIVGQGNDNVTIANFVLSASTSSNVQLQTQKGRDLIDIHNTRVGGLGVDTGSGDDELDILNSRWGNGNFDLEAGNDLLKMNGNTFVLTNANGGLGIDRLSARSNSGILVPLGFEIFA